MSALAIASPLPLLPIVVIIAPGYMPLPAPGWGAVERIVWDYYENLTKRGYKVHLVNKPNLANIISECNTLNADIVHIMYDDHIKTFIIPHIMLISRTPSLIQNTGSILTRFLQK